MKRIFLCLIMILIAMLAFSSMAFGTEDTLSIGSAYLKAGQVGSVPIYFSIFQSYGGIEIPLVSTSADLVFDSVTMSGSIVAGYMSIAARTKSYPNRIIITIFPNMSGDLRPITPPGGKLCELYFHVDSLAKNQVIILDTLADTIYLLPDQIQTVPLSGTDPDGITTLYPKFSHGHITVTALTDVDDGQNSEMIPEDFVLSQNCPNPFNPTTRISYFVPRESEVTLEVFNLLGQSVAILARGIHQTGNYMVEFNAANLSSGLYFYRLKSDQFIEVKRMLFLK